MKDCPVSKLPTFAASLFVLTSLLAACGGSSDPISLDQGNWEVSLTGSSLPVVRVKASADDGNVPANVLDGSLSTRWSCNGVGCWIRTDLSAQMSVTGLSVAWYQGNTRANTFTVSVSDDDSTYTQVYSGKSGGTTTALESYAIPATSARYVKLTVNGNTLNSWASVTELKVYGTDVGPAPVPTPTPTPSALSVTGVKASAEDGNLPANVLDGSLSTRWSCSGVGCWIRADLSAQKSVTALAVAWYQGNTRVNLFTISASNDDSTYTQVLSSKSSGATPNLEHYTIPATSARYIKLTVNGNTLNTWASVTELKVFGTDVGTPPPPTPGTCTSFGYSPWNPTVCPTNGVQTRTVATSSPAGCTGGGPVLSQSCTPAPTPAPTGTYDNAVLADSPVAFWGMRNTSGTEPDLTGNGNTGTYLGGTPPTVAMPNGDLAADFNGSSEYLTVPSKASLSISTTGSLTWEGWVRPDTLQFPNDSGYGYVDWMGKCVDYSPTCEWEARMYSTTNPEGRSNRMSAYAFNPSAGLGSAADWQPISGLIVVGHWYHIVGEYTTLSQPATCSSSYPGSINIWVNGVLWSQSSHNPTGCMSQYSVRPTANSSPLNIATMAKETWFKGAIGKVAIYNHLLSQAQITNHYQAMTGRSPSGSCGSTCTLANP